MSNKIKEIINGEGPTVSPGDLVSHELLPVFSCGYFSIQ